MKWLTKFFKQKKEQKEIILKNNIGEPMVIAKYNQELDKIELTINKPIDFIINGNVGTRINGQLDLTTFGDLLVDSFLAKIHLNSYKTKHIYDQPQAILKRKEYEKKIEMYKKWLKDNEQKIDKYAEQHFLNISSKPKGLE